MAMLQLLLGARIAARHLSVYSWPGMLAIPLYLMFVGSASLVWQWLRFPTMGTCFAFAPVRPTVLEASTQTEDDESWQPEAPQEDYPWRIPRGTKRVDWPSSSIGKVSLVPILLEESPSADDGGQPHIDGGQSYVVMSAKTQKFSNNIVKVKEQHDKGGRQKNWTKRQDKELEPKAITLPPGWNVYYTTCKDRYPYYHNKEKGLTQWDLPTK